MGYRILAPLFALAIVACASKEGDAKKGGTLFAQQCVSCHSANSNEKKLGPGLKGLFKMTKLPNGKKATEQNIRVQIDSGGSGMPPFKDMLSDQEKDDLIGYLKTL